MNKTVRMLALMMSMILMMGIFTGCSSDELSYWEKSVAYQNLAMEKPVESSAEATFSIANLDTYLDTLSKEEVSTIKPYLGYLQNGQFKVKTYQDLKNNSMKFEVYGKAKLDPDYTQLFEMTKVNGLNYVKIEPIKSMLNQLTPVSVKDSVDLNKVLGDAMYLTMTDQEILKLSSPAASEANLLDFQYNPMMTSFNYEKNQKLVDAVKVAFDNIVRKAYDKYSLNVLKKNGNRYTVDLKMKETGSLVIDFLNYTLDHADKVQSVTFDTLKSMPSETFAALSDGQNLSEADKNKMLNEAQAEVKKEMKSINLYKGMLKDNEEMIKEELSKTFGETSIHYSFDAIDETHATTNYALKLNMQEPDSNVKIDCTLDATSAVTYNSTYKVEAPVGKMMSLTEVAQKMPKVFMIYPMDDYMSYNDGLTTKSAMMPVVKKNNSYYIKPASLSAFTLDSPKVDLKKKTAVVKKGTKSITLQVEVIDKQPVVKVSELKKLGYSVKWDDENEVIIVKAL